MASRYKLSCSIQAEYFFTHWHSTFFSKHVMPKELKSLVFRLVVYWVSKAATQVGNQAGRLSVRTFRMQS